MEDIIIWIVFIAVGALWEFIGRKKGNSRSGTPSAHDVPLRDPSPSPAPARTAPEPYRATQRPKPASPPKSMPKPAYKQIPVNEILSEQTVEILPDTPLPDSLHDPSADTVIDETTRREREAHFRRWRQAIIDTQVLERKF